MEEFASLAPRDFVEAMAKLEDTKDTRAARALNLYNEAVRDDDVMHKDGTVSYNLLGAPSWRELWRRLSDLLPFYTEKGLTDLFQGISKVQAFFLVPPPKEVSVMARIQEVIEISKTLRALCAERDCYSVHCAPRGITEAERVGIVATLTRSIETLAKELTQE